MTTPHRPLRRPSVFADALRRESRDLLGQCRERDEPSGGGGVVVGPTGETVVAEVHDASFDTGGVVESTPGYGDLVTTDPGWFDLTFPIVDGGDHVVYLNFDRFSVRYTAGNLEMQAGRQRVNWGVNYVWNPNDIFNASSFFDITYIEKPGSDSFRARYYTGSTSSAEAAVKVDFDDRGMDSNQSDGTDWGEDDSVVAWDRSGQLAIPGGVVDKQLLALEIGGQTLGRWIVV